MQEIEIINVMISNFVSLILHFFKHIQCYIWRDARDNLLWYTDLIIGNLKYKIIAMITDMNVIILWQLVAHSFQFRAEPRNLWSFLEIEPTREIMPTYMYMYM